MKKIIGIAVIAVLIAILMNEAFLWDTGQKGNESAVIDDQAIEVKEVVRGLMPLMLKEIDGRAQICNSQGEVLQLRGMSTHGLQWFPEIINDNAYKALKNDWNANVIRLALYVGEHGYSEKPELADLVVRGIELAIENDMYVIVDWHVHNPGDPNADVYSGAIDFFDRVSHTFPNHPNIIYELCNEPNPNGPGVSNDAHGWQQVKNYAEPIVQMLREKGNENLIIIGTPNWSQRPDLAAEDPIDDDNICYAFHFYSGSHETSDTADDRGNVMSNVRKALDKGVAVFASEWGTTQANGNDGLFFEEASQWIHFMNVHRISWVNWSLTNKNEDSGAFVPYELGVNEGTELDPGDDLVWAVEELSLSGEFVRAMMRDELYRPIERVDQSVENKSAALGVVSFPNDFEDGTRQGWTWAVESGVRSDMTVESVDGSNALAYQVTYPDPGSKPDDDWASAPRMILSGVNTYRESYQTLKLDVYIRPERASTGKMAVYLAFAPPDLGYWAQPNETVLIDLTSLENYRHPEEGVYHVEASFDLDALMDGKVLKQDTKLRDITLVIADEDSDFSGKIYIDNIRFE